MKIFLDSADINEIKELCKTNLIDGITTNPSLIAKSGGNIPVSYTHLRAHET